MGGIVPAPRFTPMALAAKPEIKLALGTPPNYAAIRAVFPHVEGQKIIYAYGETIYCSNGARCGPEKIVHESIHLARQAGNPEAWWQSYLADPEYRLNEEILAYVAEYLFLCEKQPGRGARRRNLVIVAGNLSSPLYGRLISKDGAKKLLLDCASAAKSSVGA